MSNFATGDVTVLGNKRVGFKIVDFPSHESVRLLDGQHVAESGNALIEMKRAVAAESSKRICRPPTAAARLAVLTAEAV